MRVMEYGIGCGCWSSVNGEGEREGVGCVGLLESDAGEFLIWLRPH